MVAIKGMEMPKNCVECKLFHFYLDYLDSVIHYVCKYGNIELYGNFKNKRNDCCPLALIETDKESEE